MRPRFRHGEVVRITGSHRASALLEREGVVEEVVGPNEDGTGWNVSVRVRQPDAGDSLLLLSEADLDSTGFTEDDEGERYSLQLLPEPDELKDRVELRLFTNIADGIDAARVAEDIEQELLDLIGEAAILIEAERHWSEPFNYQLTITIEPSGDPVAALQRLADAGGDGWLSCIDDGWRCDLWWSATADEAAAFIVPHVRGAELAFLPWHSPAKRPIDERPLVAVHVQPTLDEPPELEA